MKNGYEPAFPGQQSMLIGNTEQMVPMPGLTKREYFAGLVMQAIITASQFDDGCRYTESVVAECAVLMADELLKQLESPK